jgi:hypothetical protein
MRKNDSLFDTKKIKIQNLNAKIISDGQWISNDDGGHCRCGGIFLSISMQTSATLCTIG